MDESRAKGASAPLQVDAIVVKEADLSNSVNATGTLFPNNEAVLTAEIAGRITQLNIEEGSTVAKGQLLVKINDEDLQAQLARAVSVRNLAKQRMDRLKTLLGKEGISKDEYEIGVNEYNTARADVDLINAQIRKTEIRAPFSGVVGLRYVSPGAYINSNTRVVSIQENYPLKVDFTLPERYQTLVKRGDELKFTISGSHKTFNAKVAAVSPQLDLGTRNLIVRAVTHDRDPDLKAGAFANISLKLNDIKHTIMVPTEAIIAEQRGQKVFLIKDGKAQPANVTLGIRNDSTVQVLSGINAGDSLAVTGIMYLRPGVPVRVAKSR